MSVCGRADGSDSESEEPTTVQMRELRPQKAAGKLVRLLTVLAYLLSVSMAAILLSIYYVYVWKSPIVAAAAEDGGPVADRRTDYRAPYAGGNRSAVFFNVSGGSNSTVRGNQSSEEPPTVTATQNTESETTESFPTTAEYTSSIPEEMYFDKRNNTLPVAKSTASQLLNHTKLDFNATDNT